MSVTITQRVNPSVTTHSTSIAPFLMALPIGCFILFVWTYAVNAPWFDDIDAFLGFLLAYLDSATLDQKVYNIFVPNNEHRIVVAKLITLAMYYLTGEINFRGLILIALLFILGTLGLLSRVFRSMSLPGLLFVPVLFLTLQPQYYLTSLWSIPGLQHPVVICLTLSALYLLTKPGRLYFSAAVLMQIMATLSMSNGLMGWVAGGLVLALSRQWRKLAGWVIGSALAIVLYFYNFQSAGRTGDSLAYSLAHPLQTLAAFFTFTGGLFDLTPFVRVPWRYVPPTLGGIVLAVVVVVLLYRMNRSLWVPGAKFIAADKQKRRLFFSGAYVFFYGNAAIIALLRLRYGYEVMVVSNYMIYPAVLSALVYLNLVSEWGRAGAGQRFFRVALVGSVLIWGFMYGYYWPKAAFRKQMLLTSAMNQKHNDIGLGLSWGTPAADQARSIMRQAVGRGFYRYPQSYFSPVEALFTTGQTASTQDSCLRMEVSGGGMIYKAGTALDAYPEGVGQASIVVRSSRNMFLYASETPFTFRHFWLNKPVTSAHSEILTIILPPGTYQVGALTPSRVREPLQFSCQTITIPD